MQLLEDLKLRQALKHPNESLSHFKLLVHASSKRREKGKILLENCPCSEKKNE